MTSCFFHSSCTGISLSISRYIYLHKIIQLHHKAGNIRHTKKKMYCIATGCLMILTNKRFYERQCISKHFFLEFTNIGKLRGQNEK